MNPQQYIKDHLAKYGLWLVYFVDKRASLLPLDETLQKVYDPYAFMRDAYLANRAYRITGKEAEEEPLVDPDADMPDDTVPRPPRSDRSSASWEAWDPAPWWGTASWATAPAEP